MKLLTKLSLCAVAAAALLACGAATARAQLAPSGGPTADRERSDAERDLEERIAAMRLLAARAANRRDAKRPADPKLAFEQLQEDFTRLQLVNKDLVLKSSKADQLDLKFVAKSAAEIHRRAERLMSNLALPEPDAETPRPAPGAASDSKQLKTNITALGWLIYNFARNPMFKEAQVIEPQAALKARRDLEAIIALSDQLKRSSEQLHKTTRK